MALEAAAAKELGARSKFVERVKYCWSCEICPNAQSVLINTYDQCVFSNIEDFKGDGKPFCVRHGRACDHRVPTEKGRNLAQKDYNQVCFTYVTYVYIPALCS